MKIDLYEGKYTYVIDDDGSNQRALRHGKPWRDLVGDGFVLAMAHEISLQKDKIAELEKTIKSLTEGVTHFHKSHGDMSPLLTAYIQAKEVIHET